MIKGDTVSTALSAIGKEIILVSTAEGDGTSKISHSTITVDGVGGIPAIFLGHI